jgi:hypothetical protein
LEQREGRVDRFGQNVPVVRTIMLWGEDNPIDAVVMEVLIRKAREIFRTLGVSVPVPVESESVVQALVQALFENRKADQLRLEFGDIDSVRTLHQEWDRNADRERESRTRFAQRAIKPDEVARELEAVDTVLGDPKAVRKFLIDAGNRFGFSLVSKDSYDLLDPGQLPEWLQPRIAWKKQQKLIFETPPPPKLDDAVWVGRNHPLIVALSDRILGEAFRDPPDAKFARCGAAFTNLVDRRTVLLLLRVRYRLTTRRGKEELFAEEILTAGYKRLGQKTEWLPANGKEALDLLEQIKPVGSITQQERVQRVAAAVDELKGLQKELEGIANQRADELEESHARLREYTGGGRIKATPHLPPDVMGVYVLLPGGNH